MHVTGQGKRWLLSALVVSMLLGCCGSASATVALNQYDKPQTVAGIANNQEVQAQLKSLLGNEYDAFILNYDVYGEPKYTADGGLMVEGWLQHLAQENASVFILYPDGKLFAAWISPDSNQLYYRTNSAEQAINRDIQQWASRFEDKILLAAPQPAALDFSGMWQGADQDASTFTLRLTQQGNQLSGTVCFITRQGNRIDCPEQGDTNVHGEIANNRAMLTFNSTFGGMNGKAEVVITGDKMQWRMTQPPVGGEYYAPESYTLVKTPEHKGASTRLLSTNKFTIAIRNNCGEFAAPCDSVDYIGTRNSDRSQITLKGKTLLGSVGQVIGAEFNNGNVTYRVNYAPPQLVVLQGEKILVNQPANWLK
ncbi:hypothetical protein ACUY4R_000842 [Kosakonia sp. BK9b]